MQGVALVPSSRLDVLWLDSNFAINLASFNDQSLDEAREIPPGTLITPPVAVALGPNRVHVFGLGPDYALYHWVYDASAPFGTRWTAPEMLGVNFSGTPAAVVTGTNQIDLFVLGPDRGMLHSVWKGTTWADWAELGGCFTSLPVVLSASGGTFDIFARGLDYVVYHANWKAGTVPDWQPVGGGLLGEPSAASAPAAVRMRKGIFLFVTATDGAVWYSAFDGTVWQPWVSLGSAQKASDKGGLVTFISEPVPIALFPSTDIGVNVGSATEVSNARGAVANQPPQLISSGARVDVWAVGSDNAVWQRTLNSSGWQPVGKWNRLGGSLQCAPSVADIAHSRTVISASPLDFTMVTAQTDGTIHRWTFNPTPSPVFPAGGWTEDNASARPAYRLPSFYAFAIQNVEIDNTISIHHDTDLAVGILQVGNWPSRTVSFSMGDVNSGSYELYTRIAPTNIVELCEPVIFSYSIVNNHDSGDDATVVNWVAKGLEDWVNDQLKDEGHLKSLGGLIGGTVGGLFAGPPGAILGSIIGTGFLPWLADEGIDFAFGGCDGVVAAEAIAYQSGRDVQHQITAHGSGTPRMFSASTRNLIENPPSGCRHSSYLITTSITQL